MKAQYTLIIFLLIISVILSTAVAQENNQLEKAINQKPTNCLSIGLLGEGALLSLNYEKHFSIRKKMFLAGQAGFGYNQEFVLLSDGSPTDQYFIIPHHITCNFGKKRHFFECGLSGTIAFGKTNNEYLLGPLIAYRLQPLKSNKVNLRILASIPIIGVDTDIIYLPLGISTGLCF